MHGSRRKIPSKKSRPYIYVTFLALLGAPYIHYISRLRVKYLYCAVLVNVSIWLFKIGGNNLDIE
jgi:hypothetical protein